LETNENEKRVSQDIGLSDVFVSSKSQNL